MAKSYHDHNGKEVKVTQGKNIRVTTEAWNRIRRYCFDNNLKMGAFVETCALQKISPKIKKAKP